ncbi:MAG TPA: tRNA (adenosine(37)-N6)-threonylcarbamoyltransferase complex dimerization subunit type 1 TsaB [Candidatus Saccharimonadales bacterium]|nr:tRNA (adenosine(37)-N6)-threonylcarbamoyltransferase complex dimerization subunit type 1 TsaB [Candidatus Saccharimonadales bacterium]
MLILTIRTDKPEAEIGLFNDDRQLAYEVWQAHRQLAETIHIKIKELLESQDCSLNGLNAIAVFKGPGSFTGLRIGVTVANALADSLTIPIIGATGTNWIQVSIKELRAGKNDKLVIPEYGSPPHITKPKH